MTNIDTCGIVFLCLLIIGSICCWIISYSFIEKKINDAYKRGYEIGYDYGYNKGLREQKAYPTPDEEMEQTWNDIMEMVTMNE